MLFIPNSLDRLWSLLNKACHPSEETELIVAGGDHEIAKEKISRYDFGQTLSILKVSASAHSPVSTICDQIGVKKRTFFNIGCVEKRPHFLIHDQFYFGSGARHIGKNTAMDFEEVIAILEAADQYVKTNPAKQFCLGEVGVGNTLPSTAILTFVCKKNIRDLTGSGSGVSKETVEKKITLIEEAINRHQSQFQKSSALELLSSLGGYEIAWNVGLILAAHRYDRIVLLDGFVTGIAALIAFLHNKDALKNVLATHLSREPGHQYLLEIIGLKPFLYLDLALGQGFGAVLGHSFITNTSKYLKNDHS